MVSTVQPVVFTSGVDVFFEPTWTPIRRVVMTVEAYGRGLWCSEPLRHDHPSSLCRPLPTWSHLWVLPVPPTGKILITYYRKIINENVGTTLRDRLTHSGSGLDVPRDSSTCLDIITYDELTWYDTHESRRSRTAHQTASTRLRTTRPMQASRAHNSGDTHNAIQYRAERDAHDRTHTGLTRRRSRQRAQRPANGRPEAPRARVRTHARERARSSLSTPAPTLSTLGDLRRTCSPPWPNSLSRS